MAIKITRVCDSGYETETEGTYAPWLKKFMTKDMPLPKQDTVVQQARKRNVSANYLDKLQYILHNKPRYATVEDAVKDLRKRTGLEDYLNKINAEEKTKQIKKQASDLKDRESRVDYLKTLLKKKANELKIPESLVGKESAESVLSFIKNKIEDVHGLGVTVPQIQQDIIEVFGPKLGIADRDIYNEEVAKFISDSIEEAKSLHSSYMPEPNLGGGVGQDLDPNENSDVWSGMMPQKA